MADHELGVLGALRERAQQGTRQLGQQHRLSAAHDGGDRVLAVGVDREAFAQLLEIAGQLLIGGGDGHFPDRAILCLQVDHAQVRQARHRQPRDLPHGGGHVERGRQHGARLDEQVDRRPAHARARAHRCRL